MSIASPNRHEVSLSYMTSLADRLRAAMQDAEINQKQLADAVGVKPPSVNGWLSSKAKFLRGENLLKAARTLGVSQDWLATGRGSMKPDDSDFMPISTSETPPGYVRFPLLDGFVAAGDGGYVPDYPEVVNHVDVAELWAKQNLHAPTSAIRVITARGDSMVGDVNDGDVLFVDSRVQHFEADAVYVMNWQGRPLVKRLQLRRDGTLVIRSSNPAYEPEIVPPGEIDRLHISGRVLAAWGLKRF